ncbi:endonuclease/exonuclease/phosphatase family protein [Candidatus Peregrinibacteria bacterium]|nr:endonuclease/exonuclease/phosphatase family protein [Candidatus Peregrinibacteria bacterium]
MKIATYNQMFGLNGTSCSRTLLAHFTAYVRGNVAKVERKSDIMRTIQVIEEANAHIIGICEVIGKKQEVEIVRELRKNGYQYFAIGNGRKSRYKRWILKGLLASKDPYEMEILGSGESLGFSQEDGEVLHVFFPKQNFDVIFIHLLFPRGKIRKKRHAEIVKKLMAHLEFERKGKNLLLMGDFNIRYKTLVKKYPFFQRFVNLSESLKTWSPRIFTKKFPSFDIDHILGDGFLLKNNGLIHGDSDHELLWAEVEAQN